METDKLTYTVMEMAKHLNISRDAAYALIHRADFPSARIGRRVVIPARALEKWLLEGGTVNDRI